MTRDTDAFHLPSPQKTMRQRPQLCTSCEFGIGESDPGFCRKISVTYPSLQTVRQAQERLNWQNYMVALDLPYRQHIDWIIDALCHFKGHYRDEEGNRIAVPGIACLLTPGSEWWMRDMIENGAWRTVEDVPGLRREAIGRWRLIATAMRIAETVTPICID